MSIIKEYIIKHKEMSKDNIKELIVDVFGNNMGYNALIKYNDYNFYQGKILIGYNNSNSNSQFFKILSNFEWGIIIENNAYIYVYFSGIKERIFIFRYGNEKFYKYLIYENLSNPCAYFFKDIIFYKNNYFKGSLKSWCAYESACKNFVDYYISKYNKYGYKEIKLNDLVDFFNKNGEIKTKKTYDNKFNYVKNFLLCNGAEEFNICASDFFDLYKIDYNTNINESYIEIKEIKEIFKNMNKKDNISSKRNKIMLMLSLSYGFSRNDFCNLKWDDITNSKINGYTIPLVLKDNLYDLHRKIPKSKYVIGNHHTHYNKKMTPESINTIFNAYSLNNNCRCYKLSPENIRKWLAKHLLNEGYSLQDIINLMNIDITNFKSYFSMNDIRNAKCNKIIKDGIHPMENFLRKICD